jgi:hypothetical protein
MDEALAGLGVVITKVNRNVTGSAILDPSGEVPQ